MTLVLFRNKDGKLEVSIFFPGEKLTVHDAQKHCMDLDCTYVGMKRIRVTGSERLAILALKALSIYTQDSQNCMQYVLEKILATMANWMEENQRIGAKFLH